jgi:hypothetical protein
MIVANRLERLSELKLLAGAHTNLEEGMCAMEAASWIAGENWTDHPECVCPVIAGFMRSWNDGIGDVEERTRLLTPLIPHTIGTRNKNLEERRSFMCVDWAVRTFTPEWLELCDSARYAKHVAALRSAPEITSWQSLIDITPALVDAQKEATAARDAARAAARDAARAAAWAAANLKLQPIKERLQASAAQLVIRMCELK